MDQFAESLAEPFVFLATRGPLKLPDGILLVVIDGEAARTAAELMDLFATAFEFPEYFGRNWNAFYDCLTDLDWCPPEGYVVVVSSAHAVMADEPAHPEFKEPSELAVLLDVLRRVTREWNAPVNEGQPWDRPGVPFHIVFVTETDHLAALQDRIAQTGREIPVLEGF